MALLLSLPCQFSAALSPWLSRTSTSTSTKLSPLPLPARSKPLSLPSPSTSRWHKHKPIPLFRTFSSRSNSHSNSDSDSDSDSDQNPPWMALWTQLKLILHRLRHWLKPTKFITAAFLLLMFSAFLLYTSRPTLKVVPYSDLVNGIKLGHVTAVDFEEGSRRIYFHSLSSNPLISHHHQQKPQEDPAPAPAPAPASTTTVRYLTRKMDRDEKFLLALLRDHKVIYRSVPPPVSRLLLSCIGTIAGVWIAVIPVIWILERRLHGNGTKKNRSPARQTVSFHDVQGVDSAKQELIEVVNCLQGTLDYKKLGAKLPTGILLVGPPGTGKTLLARAVAGEAGVPFFSVSASEFVELYVGRGAARVRDLFKEARQEAPAVVFIDELDAVGTERDGFSVERDQTLNQLLTEMDGFDSDKQVLVLAATNRPAALDPALMRPGRFSRKVLVGEPDLEGRKRILAVHLRGVPLEEETEVVCDLVASLTEGFVGADLANIANEAALLAVRRGGSLVTREDIMEAIEREKFGINENKFKANAVRGKGLVEMFPWIPSLAPSSFTNRNKNRDRAIGSRRVLSS